QRPQLLRLPAVQPLGYRERGIHAHHSGVEVEFGHPFETARGTLLDADAAAFAVVHEDFVETVRSIVADDARLRTDQIAVVARIARAAAEAARGFLHRLLFGVGADHFVLRSFAASRG